MASLITKGLKQASNGEPTTRVAARGLSLYRQSSEEKQVSILSTLLEKVKTFAKGSKHSFLTVLQSNDYISAHSWLQASCKAIHKEIQLLKNTKQDLSTNDMITLQRIYQQVYNISRACGPPPLPQDTSKSGGTFVLRSVPADNSCLFHCFKRIYKCTETTQQLRQQCIQYVNKNKEELSMIAGEEFVSEYENMMKQENTWGGAFEINSQCKMRRVKITLFDLINKCEQTFGDDNDDLEPFTAAFIVRVDGNHFDYLAWIENGCNERTVFSVYDDAAKRRARIRARKIQEETTTGGNDGSEWRVDGEVIKRKPTLRQSSWE
jgi:ferritin-like protein